MNTSRVPAGVPTGGQFSEVERPEPEGVTLAPSRAAEDEALALAREIGRLVRWNPEGLPFPAPIDSSYYTAGEYSLGEEYSTRHTWARPDGDFVTVVHTAHVEARINHELLNQHDLDEVQKGLRRLDVLEQLENDASYDPHAAGIFTAERRTDLEDLRTRYPDPKVEWSAEETTEVTVTPPYPALPEVVAWEQGEGAHRFFASRGEAESAARQLVRSSARHPERLEPAS
ncbi:MAG: hypothetical protein ACRCYU_02320 [Nocardioides sp.]